MQASETAKPPQATGTAIGELPLYRLHLMRAAYAGLGFGLPEDGQMLVRNYATVVSGAESSMAPS